MTDNGPTDRQTDMKAHREFPNNERERNKRKRIDKRFEERKKKEIERENASMQRFDYVHETLADILLAKQHADFSCASRK